MPSLMIIDDEPEILETTKWAFELAGFDVSTAASGEEALPRAEQLHPEVLLIDYKLPQMSGLDVLRETKTKHPEVIAIMITGLTHQTNLIEEESARLGANGFLHKPLQMETVLQIVKTQLKRGG
jgi:DNA-binding response OmpR family regulator